MMDCTDVKNFKPGGVYLQADSETTELSAEAERCTYCGRRGADNCDVPPPDVCEKAIAPEPASSEPTSPLGYHGEISARDDRTQAVMDALAQIDAMEGK